MLSSVLTIMGLVGLSILGLRILKESEQGEIRKWYNSNTFYRHVTGIYLHSSR